ncbi:MAG TPA: hypothetical protein VKZ84_00895 [Bacteriovoracaceae bacterium]|nr:hypothetical protein [Bacteriovoracaceae bacterium]
MEKFWTVYSDYLKFRHSMVVICISICASTTWAQRAPASYLPDDDMIVKPIDNEIGFYQQYVASDKSQEVIRSRNQIQIWHNNQVFAEQYGFDSTSSESIYYVPTPEEKWEYFKDRYMRYLRKRGEQPFKDMPKDWYSDFRDSQRVDTIDELEAEFKNSQRKSLVTKADLPKNLQGKEISIWGKNKFIFQPRLDQGLVIVGIKNKLVHARAWVGVNGKTEINIKHEIDSIGFRAMFNYEADTGEYFTSLDQTISENLKARFIASKRPDKKEQDERLMLLYAKTF